MPVSSLRFKAPYIKLAGLFCFLGLLWLAWHFFLERTLYLDLPFHVYHYMEESSLFIQNRRFGAAVTQIVPLLAIKGHLPLLAVLRLYSLAFIVYYFAVYLINTYVLKNEYVGMITAFLFTLVASDSFFWAQSEYPQALAFLLLFFGLSSTLQRYDQPWLLAVCYMLLLVLMYFHPVIIIPFIFLWGFDLLHRQRFQDKWYYLLLFFALALYLEKTLATPANSYDSEKISGTKNLIRFFPDYLELPSFRHFLHYCFTNYWIWVLMLLAVAARYITTRNWLKLLWVIGFNAGYVLLINVSFPTTTNKSYLENLYLPLGILAATPFVFDVLPTLRNQKVVFGLLLSIFLIRLGTIYVTHEAYTQRLDWLRNLNAYAAAQGYHKALIAEQNAPLDLLENAWATGYETLLLSALHGPQDNRTVMITPEAGRFHSYGGHQQFFGPWQLHELARMPPHYAQLPPEPYALLNTKGPSTPDSIRAMLPAFSEVKLSSPLPEVTGKAGELIWLPVTITNPASEPLRSALTTPHPAMVSTAFRGGADQLLTPLEVDITGTYSQQVKVQLPEEPGTYRLHVWLVSRYLLDWPNELWLPVTVR